MAPLPSILNASLPRNLLILGGTGFVGRALLAALVERRGGAGGRLIVPTRRARAGRLVQSLPTVEVVPADIHDPAQLGRLVAGVDAVVNLVAILHGSDRAFTQVHVELPRKIAKACKTAGVRRLVHVSALGASPQAPSRYLRSKAAGEAALEGFAAGAHQALDWTVLRPSVIYGSEDRFLNLFAQLQSALPLMALAGGDAKFQPVWVEDVADAIIECLLRPSTIGQVIECAGPKVYTLAELVRSAGRWAGHERPILPLPSAIGRLQALAFELLPGEPLMSRDNLDSMRVPNVASGALPGLASLGIEPTALEVVAPGYLGSATEGRGRLNSLRAMARRG